jgi:hypothetical protein
MLECLARLGCKSSLAKEADKKGGVCAGSEVPVDVFFVGEFPETAIAKVEVAIEEHKWEADGLLEASEVAIVQTASSMGSTESGESLPMGAIVGGALAAVLLCVVGCCLYKRGRGPVVAKAEVDTDQESDEDDDHKKKVAITTVEARAVR